MPVPLANGGPRMVVVAGVPHTGTNFVVEALRQSKEDLANLIIMPTVAKSSALLRAEVPGHSGAYEAGLSYDWINLVHSHFPEKQVALTLMAALYNPLIVPVRDPLLTLLSSHHRWDRKRPPDGPKHHAHLVDEWLRMEKTVWRFRESYHPLFFATDIVEGIPGLRESRMRELYWHAGIRMSQGEIAAFCRSWPAVNSMDDYPLKLLYRQRDLKGIRSHSKPLSQDLDYLQQKTDTLRPMLQDLGYENLLWW